MNTAIAQAQQPLSGGSATQPWQTGRLMERGYTTPQVDPAGNALDEDEFIGITTIGGAPGGARLRLTLQPLLRLAETAADRWLTVIADPTLDRSYWRQLGLSGHTLRLLQLDNRADRLWATWEALSAGNSHTVFAAIPHLSDWEQEELSRAARLGKCHGLLLISHH